MGDLHNEVAAFTAAANWVDQLVSQAADPDWEGPGIGDWNLRALVGHTSRALITVEQYLAEPVDSVDLDSAEAYYEAVAGLSDANPTAVHQRGVDAGTALGEHIPAAFHVIVERVLAIVAHTEDHPIKTIAGGMRLSNYLPTRTFELTVHGLDIAHATGQALHAPEAAMRRALDLAVSLSFRADRGPELLLALTGRQDDATGLSIF